MEGPLLIRICLVLSLLLLTTAPALAQEAGSGVRLRIATFDIGDVRTSDLLKPDEPRLRAIAETLQRLRPNVVLLSGLSYDTPGGPDVKDGLTPGQNARRLIDKYLAVPQREGLQPLRYSAYFEPVNSGVPSARDLNHDGQTAATYPSPPGRMPDGTNLPWSSSAEIYAADCWGRGAFPGQHGMVLLVDERLRMITEKARTFRAFPWDYMGGALGSWKRDLGGDIGTNRTTSPRQELLEADRPFLRLSSSGHWDVPIELPNKAVLHLLCSRPCDRLGTDSPSTRRNHDEIRFWADYVEELGYFVDDRNHPGGLAGDAPFVILGNLGAPPEATGGLDPIGTTLLGARRVNGMVVPRAADLTAPDDAATTISGQRCDYILPSRDLGIASAGIWRLPPEGSIVGFPAAHFPVWMEVVVPAPIVPLTPELSTTP